MLPLPESATPKVRNKTFDFDRRAFAMTGTTGVLTKAELDLMPTDVQVESCRAHGWQLSKKLLADEEADSLISASERFCAGHRDGALPSHPLKIAYWTSAAGDVRRHNHDICDEVGTIMSKPIIGAVAAHLASALQVRRLPSTTVYKPARTGEQSNVMPGYFAKHCGGLHHRAVSPHPQDGGDRRQPYPLPDGSMLSCNHDHLVRKNAQGEPDYADPEFRSVLRDEPTREGNHAGA